MHTVKATRNTKQRQLILDILHNTTSHPTAENIYVEARNTLPDISLGTVYRNLQLLVEQGEVLELNYGKSMSHYDGNVKPHNHFACRNCGRVYDMPLDFSYDLLGEARGKTSWNIDEYRLEFYGTCDNCSMKNK